jgi:hypothetical protein
LEHQLTNTTPQTKQNTEKKNKKPKSQRNNELLVCGWNSQGDKFSCLEPFYIGTKNKLGFLSFLSFFFSPFCAACSRVFCVFVFCSGSCVCVWRQGLTAFDDLIVQEEDFFFFQMKDAFSRLVGRTSAKQRSAPGSSEQSPDNSPRVMER